MVSVPCPVEKSVSVFIINDPQKWSLTTSGATPEILKVVRPHARSLRTSSFVNQDLRTQFTKVCGRGGT